MTVKQSMGYAIECDFPGCGTSTQDLGDYAFWGDLSDAIEEWTGADGYADELGYYCREHTVWTAVDDDEDGDIDERTPMPYTVDNLFVLAERRVADRIESRTRRAMYDHGNRVRDAAARSERAFNALDRKHGVHTRPERISA